ncbi:MAG TPA: pirin-like C-terminal cupin domain-containing protein, partial [Casimicrobiaceae bacterium]|nr:pirin-like C-terminal cupin domain-containing protein [Casimicrobiaceae bacterium]
VQRISAGDVNWMTAGRGIVHSERTAPDDRAIGRPLHGLQTWVGLPLAHEETEPSFTHLPASALPRIEREGVQVIVVAGSAFGQRAPTPVFSATLYAATLLAPGASITLDTEHEQRAVYAVEGDIDVDGERIGTTEMAVLPADVKVSVGSAKGGKAMIVGGAPLDGTRFVWWNFVASSREKIEAAKQRWLEQQFGRVPGETEFIPLPDTPVPPSPPASPNQTPPAPPFS